MLGEAMRGAIVLSLILIGCEASGIDETSADPTTGGGTFATSTSTSSATQSATTDTGPESTGGDTLGECELPPASYAEVAGCDAVVGEPGCSEGQQHVIEGSEIEWMADPPHSGPHYPMWGLWGEHDTVVPRGTWIHNLEHGGIVLAYRCNDDCPDELEVLRQVIAMRPDLRVLLTKDPLLTGERFAAISWTWVHRFDAPDLASLLCFADQHEGQAPEDVP